VLQTHVPAQDDTHFLQPSEANCSCNNKASLSSAKRVPRAEELHNSDAEGPMVLDGTGDRIKAVVTTALVSHLLGDVVLLSGGAVPSSTAMRAQQRTPAVCLWTAVFNARMGSHFELVRMWRARLCMPTLCGRSGQRCNKHAWCWLWTLLVDASEALPCTGWAHRDTPSTAVFTTSHKISYTLAVSLKVAKPQSLTCVSVARVA
jgi:hypothetical protein